MANGFKWKLCNYVGGQTAVKPSMKGYTLYDPDAWAGGEFTVQPRDTSDISITCGFRPSVVFFTCYRPKFANFQNDSYAGLRGGGMTFGVAGLTTYGDQWEADITYNTGDVVYHEGAVYIANDDGLLNDEPPSANWDAAGFAQFSGSSRFQQGFDINIGVTSWREDRCLEVLWNNNGTGSGTGFPAFSASLGSFNANGFTLDVHTNLYDQTDQVMWLAMAGNFQVGVMTAGDTEITDFFGTPRTAVFFSTKHTLGDTHKTDRWTHMTGMASPESNNAFWGGGEPVGWNFTTERWHDQDSILFCTSASGSLFVGTSVDQVARVVDWHSGGLDLQWSVFNNVFYRIGYVLHDGGTTGYLETNWNLRPEVAGENFEPALISPRVILMTGTNYAFNQGTLDPLTDPRLPNAFHGGAGARLGWHIYPYNEANSPADAWGVSTYANSRQERGHYSNSATQLQRNCISAGAGANSQPPAPHQHGVNVVPIPLIVGTNYRYAERHGHIKRLHVNPSDV